MSRSLPHIAVIGTMAAMLLVGLGGQVAAQEQDMVGSRVRVGLLDGVRSEGVVVAWEPRNLSLRTTGEGLVEFEWSEVRDVTRFETRRRTGRGLGLGALIGGVGTGLVVAVAVEPCSGTGFCIGPDSRLEGAVVGAFLGAALGGVAGMVVGTMVRTSSWEPVASPGASSAAFSLGLRWRPSQGSGH